MRLMDYVWALAVVAIWGANAAIAKLAVPDVPAISFLVLRFALTALLFLPFIQWRRAYVWPCGTIALLLNVLHYGLIFSAMPHLSASALSLIQQIQVPIAMLVGWMVFKERLQLRLWVGIGLGFVGLSLVKSAETVTLLGFVLAVLGSVAWAWASLEMKRQPQIPLPTFMGLTTLFSLPFLGMAAWLHDGDILTQLAMAYWHAVGGVLAYQILLGSGAMMLWKNLLGRCPMNRLVPLTLLQPLFGVSAGMLIFAEQLSPLMLLGGGITMLGVGLIVVQRPALPNTAGPIID
jgi:O-acetylserine/cysteine efflux transporter